MLSRVANTLYWMVRYVERADNLARLIDVNQQLLLDFESLDSERLRGFWQPIIQSTGDEEAFSKLYDDTGSNEVIRFLTDDPRNPNSISSCIALARENARTVRDQLSDELWEELNALYLFSRSDETLRLIESGPPRYYENIRRSAMTFLGTAASTTSRNEAWGSWIWAVTSNARTRRLVSSMSQVTCQPRPTTPMRFPLESFIGPPPCAAAVPWGLLQLATRNHGRKRGGLLNLLQRFPSFRALLYREGRHQPASYLRNATGLFLQRS
jgi:hypothetical protein